MGWKNSTNVCWVRILVCHSCKLSIYSFEGKGFVCAIFVFKAMRQLLCWLGYECFTCEFFRVDSTYRRVVEAVASNPCVSTPQGRGRLFIRHGLKNKCLHMPVETIVRKISQLVSQNVIRLLKVCDYACLSVQYSLFFLQNSSLQSSFWYLIIIS